MKKGLDSYCISFVALGVNDERFKNNKSQVFFHFILHFLHSQPSITSCDTVKVF